MKKIGKINLKDINILSDSEMKNIQGGNIDSSAEICFGVPGEAGVASSGTVLGICGSREVMHSNSCEVFCCNCWQSVEFCGSPL